jgi:4a-hydroxytetrahydrobiopterin dehydratase
MTIDLWQRAGFTLVMAIAILLSGVSIVEAEPNYPVRLNEVEISDRLQQLPGWTVRNQQLVCTYRFDNFVEAIAFVNRLVEPAETAGHHPDLMVSYGQVTVSLTTHDAGGLTEQDFALARAIAQLSEPVPPIR